MDFNASFPDFLLSSLEFFSRLSGNRISMAKAGMRNTPGIDSGRDATPLGLGYPGGRSSRLVILRFGKTVILAGAWLRSR